MVIETLRWQKITLRISAFMFFLCSSAAAYAQVKVTEEVQLDTLTKIIGIGLTLGGFFMGYMQMKMANKIAEVEAKFNQALNIVESKFTNIIHTESERQNSNLRLGLKELETKMVTKDDIASLKNTMALQHENIQLKIETATRVYQRDREK